MSQGNYGNKEDNMVNTSYGPTRQYVVFLKTSITTAGEGREGSEELLVRAVVLKLRLASSRAAVCQSVDTNELADHWLNIMLWFHPC